ncbi:MAG: hypothetical protein AB1403_01680 [Candidatus Riflebacteria bacterium]
MINNKRYFIAGVLAATFGVAGIFSIDSIQAAGSRLQAEIKFARQIGIYDSTSYSSKMLGRPIAEQAFYRGLTSVMYELNFIESLSPEEMKHLGIIPSTDDKAVISRKAAIESMFRAISFAVNSGAVKPSRETANFQPFYDWIIEEKYMQGLGEALDRGIIKGMPNGRFCPNAHLKTSDALVLFKRMFDAYAVKTAEPVKKEVVAIEPGNKPEPSTGFNLERLQKAGAFSTIDCNVKMDPIKPLKLKELYGMLHGILTQADKPAYITELKYFVRNRSMKRKVTRTMLAGLGSIMVRALPCPNVESKALYADVKTGSGLDRALGFLSRAGIRLGYENNQLKGYEIVTTEEAVGMLNKIVNSADQFRQNHGISATRNDLESFKALIEGRKARIRRILNRNSEPGN